MKTTYNDLQAEKMEGACNKLKMRLSSEGDTAAGSFCNKTDSQTLL